MWLQPGSSNSVVPLRIISAVACRAYTAMSSGSSDEKDG
jgi:hypothetical protein